MGRARREIHVEGTVQGVGFRPATHRLAAAPALASREEPVESDAPCA